MGCGGSKEEKSSNQTTSSKPADETPKSTNGSGTVAKQTTSNQSPSHAHSPPTPNDTNSEYPMKKRLVEKSKNLHFFVLTAFLLVSSLNI